MLRAAQDGARHEEKKGELVIFGMSLKHISTLTSIFACLNYP